MQDKSADALNLPKCISSAELNIFKFLRYASLSEWIFHHTVCRIDSAVYAVLFLLICNTEILKVQGQETVDLLQILLKKIQNYSSYGTSNLPKSSKDGTLVKINFWEGTFKNIIHQQNNNDDTTRWLIVDCCSWKRAIVVRHPCWPVSINFNLITVPHSVNIPLYKQTVKKTYFWIILYYLFCELAHFWRPLDNK